MQRQDTYISWIKQGAKKLETFQNEEERYKGCFCYPYWRKQTTYVNSRWQEASLTFAWLYKKTGNPAYKEIAQHGVAYWCRLQHRKGSFPEYSRLDSSFAATAFTTLAMAETAKKIPFTPNQHSTLLKAADWLLENDELTYTNQQAAAAAALFSVCNLTENQRYFIAAQKKLAKVFSNQHTHGYYTEKNGFDLGYSTLTLEMLGISYILSPHEKILSSAQKFIDFILTNKAPSHNIRGTTWIIIDGFEIFADKVRNGKKALLLMLKHPHIKHLGHDQNLCTDLYRYCWAHDHATANLNHGKLNEHYPPQKNSKPSKLLNPLRPFGLHNIRNLLQ